MTKKDPIIASILLAAKALAAEGPQKPTLWRPQKRCLRKSKFARPLFTVHTLVALFFCIVALTASIQNANANVVGADTQNFNPTNDGLDFVTVHSSETLEPGLLNMGFFLNYAVNSLPNYENTSTQSRTNFSDSLLSMDLNFALGIQRGWEVGLSTPALLYQNVDSDVSTFRGEFANTGVTEFRMMTKVRFFGAADHGMGAVASINMNQIEDNPFLGTDAGPTFNFELVGDRSFGKFAVGLNGGYRWRNPGKQLANVPIEPLGNQWIASSAVSYLIEDWDTKWIAEIFGSVPSDHGQFVSDREDSSAEFLTGLKHDVSQSLALHVGGGTEIIHGTSSPDWRVYTGLNWVIGPLYSKPQEPIVRYEDEIVQALEALDSGDPFVGPAKNQEKYVARDILFEFNSDRLHPSAKKTLQKLVDYLGRGTFVELTIEGHTDSVGSKAYNLDLSQRRSNSVRRALIEMGIEAKKVKAKGYGEALPIADNGNYQGRAMNRRVEFRIER